MERMNVQTEVAQNSAAHRTALQSLLAMNGNMPLSLLKPRILPYRKSMITML